MVLADDDADASVGEEDAMLITSATRSPAVSAETAAFTERQLLRDLERRRRVLEMHAELQAGASTQLAVRDPMSRRLVRAARAFIAAVRTDGATCDEVGLPTPAHR